MWAFYSRKFAEQVAYPEQRIAKHRLEAGAGERKHVFEGSIRIILSGNLRGQSVSPKGRRKGPQSLLGEYR